MKDYKKLEEDFKNKIYQTRYEDVISIFKVYLDLNPQDVKVLLDVLKNASLKTREKQTIESVENDESKMLKEIFLYIREKNLLTSEDVDFVKNYIEEYTKVGNLYEKNK